MWSGTKSAIGRAALWMVGSASYVHEIAERQREVAALSRAAAKDLAGSGLSGSNDQNLWMALGEVACSGRTFSRMI